jgi:hypothetical protein
MCHLLKKQKQKFPIPNETERHTFERTEFVVSEPQTLLLILKVTDSETEKYRSTVMFLTVFSVPGRKC